MLNEVPQFKGRRGRVPRRLHHIDLSVTGEGPKPADTTMPVDAIELVRELRSIRKVGRSKKVPYPGETRFPKR